MLYQIIDHTYQPIQPTGYGVRRMPSDCSTSKWAAAKWAAFLRLPHGGESFVSYHTSRPEALSAAAKAFGTTPTSQPTDAAQTPLEGRRSHAAIPQEVVEHARALRAESKSIRVITEMLANAGIVSTRTGVPYTEKTVRAMIDE